MSKIDMIDKGTQLSTCARHSNAKTKVFLLAVLKDTIDYVEANKTLNQIQMQVAVDEILREFWYLKLEEVVYLLDRLKYEKFYERLKYGEIRDFIIQYEEKERSYIIESIMDSRKKYELNQVDYDAYKKWQKENPPKKKQEQSDYNNYKAHYNTTQARCKAIAMKVMTGSKLNESDLEFYKKNKTTIELIRLSLNKKV
tara:strand:+ start:3725 stop:4318 length:594 start_codon:yes stop_codon:yes gene_type:complete